MLTKIAASLLTRAASLAARFGSVDGMAWIGILFIVASLVVAGGGR